MEGSRTAWLSVGILGCIVGAAVTVGAERSGFLEPCLRRLGFPAVRQRVAEALVRMPGSELAGELDLSRTRIEELEKLVAALRAEAARGREAAADAARLASEVETLRDERDRFEAETLVEREKRRAIEDWAAGRGSPEVVAPSGALTVAVLSARPDLALVVIDRGRGQGVSAGQEFCPPPGADGSARVIIDEVREGIAIGQVVPSSAAVNLPVGSVLVERRP
jgi:hypothetical protein